jgi:hypothetical protein
MKRQPAKVINLEDYQDANGIAFGIVEEDLYEK